MRLQHPREHAPHARLAAMPQRRRKVHALHAHKENIPPLLLHQAVQGYIYMKLTEDYGIKLKLSETEYKLRSGHIQFRRRFKFLFELLRRQDQCISFVHVAYYRSHI